MRTKKQINHNLLKRTGIAAISLLMLLGSVQANPVITVSAKEIGSKNEAQKAVCEAVINDRAPVGYASVLGTNDKSVYRGGNARSGIQNETDPLDNDPNDFAAPLPYGNIFVDTSKLNWFNPSGFIIDIKDDRFQWVAVDDKHYVDAKGKTTTNDPLGSGKPLKGRTPDNGGGLDTGAANNGFIAYVGELKPYHSDIKAKADSNGFTNVIKASDKDLPYLYQITYLNAATLADGTKGNVVMTMTQVDIETSMSISVANPRKLIDKNGNEYSYTKAVMPIQDANNLRVAAGVVDSEGNWVNEPYTVAKTKEEVQASIDEANANIPDNIDKIGSGMVKDKMIRHTAGGAYTFEIKVLDSEGHPAVGTMAYAANDLDLPSYQNIWGRDRTDPFMYSEGLTIVKGSQSYALVPEYNHSDGNTVNEGWVPKGLGGSWNSPLDIKKEGSGPHADGVSFRSNGEKVLRDKNGLWKDAFTSWNENNDDPLMAIPDGSIRDFRWHNLNRARLEDKNNLSTDPLDNNIKKQLAGKIDKTWDQITAADAVAYIKNGSYAVERADDSTYDTGFAVLIDPAGTTFRWTGSSYNNGSAVTRLFDTTLFSYVEQTHGAGGGIYIESYDLNNNANTSPSPVMDEGTVTMARNSETTVTAVPEKGYRVSKITIGNTNYKDHSNPSLTDYVTYTIDGDDIKDQEGRVLATFGSDGKATANGFFYDKNDNRKTELEGNNPVKFTFEKNADGTIDVTLPNVDNPMHVHVDFGADYYFYKVWVGGANETPTKLELTAAPYGYIPTEVTIPMPTGAVDGAGHPITEEVTFTINKHEYTATDGTYKDKKFTLTPNGTLLYSETDDQGQETVHVESMYKLVGNEFVHETGGQVVDRRRVTIEERIADWKSNYAVKFEVDDTPAYENYVKTETVGNNTVWKIKYPSEGVDALDWDPLPVDVTSEREDSHDAVTHIDRNYWFVIEDKAPSWVLDGYDSSSAQIPGVVPAANVNGSENADYYKEIHWAKDAEKDVAKATNLVQVENKNTAAFLSVFKDGGGKITNVPMAIVKGTKDWEDFNNAYNNRKDIWLHIDASIVNSDGSTTSYKDVLPAQKVAKDALDSGLTKTWGDKTVYDTGESSVKVVENRDNIPDGAVKQGNGSFVLNNVTYWVNELKKVNDKGVKYTYSIRETLDRQGNNPVVKDDPDQGLLGYKAVDVNSSLDASTTDFTENSETISVTLYEGAVTNTLATIDYEAKKVWDDNNDQDGYRTDISFVLEGLNGDLPDGQQKVQGISKANNETTVTWTGLPKYENGAIVPYAVSEAGMDEAHYSLDFRGEEDEYGNVKDVFTNIHIPETASISIFKKWDDADNQDGLRKELSEAVELQGKTEDEPQFGSAMTQDGTPIVKGSVPTEDGLIITWMNVPVKRNGKEITYKVIENIAGLTGYTTDPGDLKYEFTVTNNQNKEATFTNKRTPELTEITITKEWDDMENQFGKRPDEITVQLKKTYQEKTDTEKTVDKQVTVNGVKYTVKTSTEDIEYFKIGDKYYRSDDIDRENAQVADYEELLPFDPDDTGENVQNGKFHDVGNEKYPVLVTEAGKEYYVKEDGKYYDPLTDSELTSGENDFNPADSDEYATENMTVEVDGADYEVKLGKLAGEEQWYYVKDGKYYGWQGNELTKFVPADGDAAVQIQVPDAPTYAQKEETEDIVLKASENWTKTIQVDVNSPVAQKIAYGVDELEVPSGYMKSSVTSTEDGKFVVTNRILPPTANPDESINYKGVPQTGTPTFEADKRTTAPDGGENKIERITLLDQDGNETDEVTVPGEGTYKLNEDGTITFTPEPEFVGKTSGVKVRGYDSNDLHADTTYTPTVIHKVKYVDPLNPEGEQVVKGPEDSNTSDGSDIEDPDDYIEGEESRKHPGYRFDGWDEEEVDDPDMPGTKIIVRTAKYTPMYNINYDPNGGTGEMEDNNYMADDPSMPHDKNTFTREGYSFIGFKAYITDPTTGEETPILDKNGEPIIFHDANEMKEYFKDMPGGTSIRMEAHWKRHEYHIHYDPNGGTGTMTSQDFTGDDTSAVSKENTFTRDGYRFTGFRAVTKDGKEIGFFTSTADFLKYLEEQGDGGEVTLIAQWEPVPQLVSQPVPRPLPAVKSSPQTGDSSNPLLYILLLAGSVVLGVYFARKSKLFKK